MSLGEISCLLLQHRCMSIIAADCCRNDLAHASVPSRPEYAFAGLQIDQCAIYATSSYNTAYETMSGSGGLFTRAFIDVLEEERSIGANHRDVAGMLRKRLLDDVAAFRKQQVC